MRRCCYCKLYFAFLIGVSCGFSYNVLFSFVIFLSTKMFIFHLICRVKHSTKGQGHAFLPRPVFESTTLVFKQYKTTHLLCSDLLLKNHVYGLESSIFKDVGVFEGTTKVLTKKVFGETTKNFG